MSSVLRCIVNGLVFSCICSFKIVFSTQKGECSGAILLIFVKCLIHMHNLFLFIFFVSVFFVSVHHGSNKFSLTGTPRNRGLWLLSIYGVLCHIRPTALLCCCRACYRLFCFKSSAASLGFPGAGLVLVVLRIPFCFIYIFYHLCTPLW